MKTNKIYLIITFCALAITTHAQELRRDSTKHEKGTTEVIVFTKDGGSNTATPKPGEDGPNVVKIGLTDWVSGYIPFYYERRVLPWLSVQVGLGITTRDFVGDAVNAYINDNDYSNYSHRKATVGPFVSLQPKFYVHSDALDGFFVSPMLAFKQWNFSANSINVAATSASVSGDIVYEPGVYQREYRNAVDFTANIGWQWLFHPVTLEFMLGGGFRKFWESRVNTSGNVNPITGNVTYNNGTTNFSGFRPDVNLSLNLGGFF